MIKPRTVVDRFVDELDLSVFGVGFSMSLLAIAVFFLNPEASAEMMGRTNEFLWTEYMWVYVGTMCGSTIFFQRNDVAPMLEMVGGPGSDL